MRIQYSAIVLALLIAQAAISAPLDGESIVPSIDRHTAIELGDYKVSRYLVAKYFGRYSQEVQQTQHRLPTDAERKEWFDLFIAKEVVIAHAETLGYAARPEVVSVVSHMERSMLTEAIGALFRSNLEKQKPLSSADLAELHQKTATLIDGIVARFLNPQIVEDGLGADFDELPTDKQTVRVLQCAQLAGVELQEKRFSWPYLPFSEIAGTLETAPTARWIKTTLPGYGEYYVFVKDHIQRPISNWKPDDEGFREWVDYKRLQSLYQQFRVKSLLSAGFTLESSVASSVFKHCFYTMTEYHDIPSFPAEAEAGSILFRYLIDSRPQAVTAEQFRTHFNGQYIRREINDITALRQECEEMATEELIYLSAKAQGLEHSPRFSEDRFGFTGFQVLDRFEQEQIAPRISIESSRVESYYKAHAAEYRQPLKIEGRLVTFGNLDEAVKWKAEVASRDRGNRTQDTPSISNGEIEVGLAEPLSGFGLSHDLLFTCPEGTVLGPIQNCGRFLCFFKERNLLFGSRPFGLMVDKIRGMLLRQELDFQELKLAGEWSRDLHLKVESLDLLKQGLSFAQWAH